MNRLTLFMTDKRIHIKTISDAINDKKLENINLIGSLTNNKNTYNYLHTNFRNYNNHFVEKNNDRQQFEYKIL